MQPRSIENIGLLVTGTGALFIALGGAYFYEFIQTLAAAGGTGSTTSLLSAYNSMLGMPIIVTLSIFGLGMIIVGGFFIASAHVTQQLVGYHAGNALVATTTADARPSKVCIKCGSLLYQNTPYCPNCGNPVTRVPSVSS